MELAIIPQISNAPAELPEAEWSWNNMQEADVLKTKEVVVGRPHFKNDVGYADAFANRYRGRIKFIAEEEVWLLFDNERGWHRDKSGEALALCTEYSRELYEQALTEARNAEDQQAGANRVREAAKLGDSKRIKPALEFAKVSKEIRISVHDIDQDPHLLGVTNGVVDLRDGSFNPHSPDVFVTRSCNCKFIPNATCPTFMKFLEDVHPDALMQSFLQRLFGFTLTGGVEEHILAFHYGTGANGKGTTLEQVFLRLMGSYGAKLTDNFVYLNNRGASPDLEIAGLFGIRLALGDENESGGALNERLLKAATGGDKQKGRRHFQDYLEYFPTAKIHLVGNHRPKITGVDEGFWRRFRLINWGVSIPENKRDSRLAEKLAKEFPGILNWAIQGAIEWYSSGTQAPDSVIMATDEFREESDAFGDFLREKTVEEENGSVSVGHLFFCYKHYCDDQDTKPSYRLNKRSFGLKIASRGYTQGKINRNERAWKGIRVREQGDQ